MLIKHNYCHFYAYYYLYFPLFSPSLLFFIIIKTLITGYYNRYKRNLQYCKYYIERNIKKEWGINSSLANIKYVSSFLLPVYSLIWSFTLSTCSLFLNFSAASSALLFCFIHESHYKMLLSIFISYLTFIVYHFEICFTTHKWNVELS